MPLVSEQVVVLIVDRDGNLVDLVIRAFKPFRLSIFGAATADEAKVLIETLRPNLIIVDPAVDKGFALLSEICSSGLGAEIMAVTSSDEMMEKLRGLDIDHVVIREEHPGGLIDAIVMVLGNRLISPPQAEPARILVASVEEGPCDVLCEFLRLRGYFVASAVSGNEVLETLDRDPPFDLVILDVVLPGKGGIETLKELMERAQHPGVIMMSSLEDREIVRQAMNMGAFDCLMQPFDLEALENSIVACLADSEYRKRGWWKRFAS